MKSKQYKIFSTRRLNMKKWVVVLMIMIVYLSTGAHGKAELPEIQIASGENNQEGPSIYNNLVVWQEKRGEKVGTYGYDLSTQKEFHIAVD
jgi:beta propeller repeat protein